MKNRLALSLLFILGILVLAGCGNKKKEEFKKDVAGLGDVMCRIMEVSNKLLASQSATPLDILVIEELQMKKDSLERKMNDLNTEFKKKYEKQMTDPEFVKDFRSEIKKTMLDCKYLSKEDRERYEKEVE
jgi:outer membrane murein-binding lipoprotein Lpp